MHGTLFGECYRDVETTSATPVGEQLQLLSSKLVLIQQHMVVAGPVGALDPSMAVQVEVKLCRVANVPIHQGTCTVTHPLDMPSKAHADLLHSADRMRYIQGQSSIAL